MIERKIPRDKKFLPTNANSILRPEKRWQINFFITDKSDLSSLDQALLHDSFTDLYIVEKWSCIY